MIHAIPERRKLLRAALVSPLLLAPIACDDDSEPPPQTALPGT